MNKELTKLLSLQNFDMWEEDKMNLKESLSKCKDDGGGTHHSSTIPFVFFLGFNKSRFIRMCLYKLVENCILSLKSVFV